MASGSDVRSWNPTDSLGGEYRTTESSTPCVKFNGGVNVSDADFCACFADLLPVAVSFFLLVVGIGDGDMENEASESVWSLPLLGIDAKSSGAGRLLLRAETIFNQWPRTHHNGTIRKRLDVNNLIGGISSTTDQGR